MIQKHKGRLAVVTGGARGIGREIVLRLSAEGAEVVVVDVIDAKETIAKMPENGGKITGFRCDVSNWDEMSNMAAEVKEKIGNPDILIHCAAAQFMKPISEISIEEWRMAQQVNLDGGFILVKMFLEEMRKAGWGRIVMIASSSFFAPPAQMSHYIASKGALIGFVRGLATEVGVDGITVNALAPGLTLTAKAAKDVPPEHFDFVLSRQAVKRAGKAEDQAAAISYIVSDEAGFMSGQTMLVDGGEGHL